MNNPFGLPDEVFNAILESAFTGTVKIPSQPKDKKAGNTPGGEVGNGSTC